MSTKSYSDEEKIIIREIKASLRMVGTVIEKGRIRKRPQQQIIYASSPVSTGKRMYELFEKYNVFSVEELNTINNALYSEMIVKQNILHGVRFGRTLRKLGYTLVIVPGVFPVEGWTQEQIMSLWEQVIIKYVDVIHFNKDWQYSNGCVEEFLIGLQHNKKLWEGNKVLAPEEGHRKIQQAIEELDRKGISTKKLFTIFRRISLHMTSV